MPIRNTWLIDKRVIFTQAWGEVTREDFLNWVDELEEYQRTGEKPIHIIQDRERIAKPHLDLKDAGKLITVGKVLGGWFLTYGSTDYKVFNFVTSIITQAIGIRTRPPFASFEQTWQFLAEQDPTLPTQAPSLPTLIPLDELDSMKA